ncbi:MAG: glycosyltransferase family 4 protein [Emcibacter sp.]|nr:glycosyltransferase family 4 protein [Emcibacter sp.]
MTKKMDIPHIFHVIPSFSHGGVPIRISYLMNHFGKKARHSILATNGDYACSSRLSDSVDYSIPDIKNAAHGNILSRILQYRKILHHLKPDLLLTYNWGSTEWALAHSFKPTCRHFHLESGFGPEEAESTLPRRNLFRRIALRNIDGIVVPSQTLVNICKSDWKIPESKIHYIPNGVDCDLYASPPQADIIQGFKKQKDVIVIGTMTPLRPEKNLTRLINAFHDLAQTTPDKKFNLIIMGEGNERHKLESLIAHYGLTDNVYLPGHIDDPARALGLLDIYAISSDTEQMPNSLNQAMAASLPIVGLDVGDVKFMMSKDNKPFIVAKGDDTAFAEALKKLAADQNLRKKIGEINKYHVNEHFDQKHMFAAYAKIWQVDN